MRVKQIAEVTESYFFSRFSGEFHFMSNIFLGQINPIVKQRVINQLKSHPLWAILKIDI